MSLQSDLKSKTSGLAVGNSMYVDCPKCGRTNKCGVTSTTEGLVYHCFSASCNYKGMLPSLPSKESIAHRFNKKTVQHSLPDFRLPDYLIDGFATETGLSLALKYDLLDAYGKGAFRTAYDPRLNRQVFYYKNQDNGIIGATGRALEAGVTPKAHIYLNSTKTPWVIPNGNHAVIVEDIFSAVKAYNVGYTGIALSGTTLQKEYLTFLSGYDTIRICLDKDATIKAFTLRDTVGLYCKDTRIIPLEKDLKDMTRDEARKVLS